jgi:hypothetical protein
MIIHFKNRISNDMNVSAGLILEFKIKFPTVSDNKPMEEWILYTGCGFPLLVLGCFQVLLKSTPYNEVIEFNQKLDTIVSPLPAGLVWYDSDITKYLDFLDVPLLFHFIRRGLCGRRLGRGHCEGGPCG